MNPSSSHVKVVQKNGLCEIPCLTIVDLDGNRLFKTWRKLWMSHVKTFFKEFDFVWCVEGLIITRRNLVVTWNVNLHMDIVS